MRTGLVTDFEVRRQRLLDIDEHPGAALGDLVQKNGSIPTNEGNRPVFLDGQPGVLQDGTNEVTASRGLHSRVPKHGRPEIRETAVCDDDEVRIEAFLDHPGVLSIRDTRILPHRADANDAPGELALDEVGHRRLDHVHARSVHGLVPECHDEPAVVEAPALEPARIGNLDGAFTLSDAVAVRWDRTDILETRLDAELLEGEHAAWLEQLADDSVGLGERSFEEGDAQGPCAGWRANRCEGVRKRRASYASADDEDVVVGFWHPCAVRWWSRAKVV